MKFQLGFKKGDRVRMIPDAIANGLGVRGRKGPCLGTVTHDQHTKYGDRLSILVRRDGVKLAHRYHAGLWKFVSRPKVKR